MLKRWDHFELSSRLSTIQRGRCQDRKVVWRNSVCEVD